MSATEQHTESVFDSYVQAHAPVLEVTSTGAETYARLCQPTVVGDDGSKMPEAEAYRQLAAENYANVVMEGKPESLSDHEVDCKTIIFNAFNIGLNQQRKSPRFLLPVRTAFAHTVAQAGSIVADWDADSRSFALMQVRQAFQAGVRCEVKASMKWPK